MDLLIFQKRYVLIWVVKTLLFLKNSHFGDSFLQKGKKKMELFISEAEIEDASMIIDYFKSGWWRK